MGRIIRKRELKEKIIMEYTKEEIEQELLKRKQEEERERINKLQIRSVPALEGMLKDLLLKDLQDKKSGKK